MHRVLQWSTAARGQVADFHALAAAAVAEFELPPSASEAVRPMHARIRHSPALQRFFDPPQWGWSADEFDVVSEGESLRIDRLVRLGSEQQPQWWVLDYKLAFDAAADEGLRRQLPRYRNAVQALTAARRCTPHSSPETACCTNWSPAQRRSANSPGLGGYFERLPALRMGSIVRTTGRAGRRSMTVSHTVPDANTSARRQPAASPAFGRFKLQRLLGKSAGTLVWLATDPSADEELVLVMPRVQVSDRAQLQRHLQAAQKATRVTHPGLAVAVEVGEHERWPYAAYARAQSSTLAELTASQGSPALDVARWSMPLLDGLAFAHEAGLAHRDIQAAWCWSTTAAARH